jgi:hypothetical protein
LRKMNQIKKRGDGQHVIPLFYNLRLLQALLYRRSS